MHKSVTKIIVYLMEESGRCAIQESNRAKHKTKISAKIETFVKDIKLAIKTKCLKMYCNQPIAAAHKSTRIYYSIPVAALLTKNYKRFREIILDHFVDINTQINLLMRKINTEQTILATDPELSERDKSAIRNYVIKLEREVATLIQVSNDLHIRIEESRLKKLFKKIHPLLSNPPCSNPNQEP